MPRKRAPRTKAVATNLFVQSSALPSIPAAEVLSFLRETRGMITWTAHDMAESLKIRTADAQRIIPVLELQGYAKAAETGQWMTTLAGEEVAGSKPPRYTRERVEEALSSLRDRIAQINRDSHAPYEITEAVAFGDFLRDRSRVQPAEVGIKLVRRKSGSAGSDSANEHKAQRAFLKALHKGGIVSVRPLEKWMEERTHRDLL